MIAIAKHYFFMLLLLVVACSHGQHGYTRLSATEFSQKISQTNDPVIVDVRTPGEYANGHLANALNIDWNGENFEKEISALDKNKPVFIYCMSGGRSSSAATKMVKLGFTTLYEMDGGILQWRRMGFEEMASKIQTGMTKTQFENLYKKDRMVLIDFYAPWCAPCKKMTPYLSEIGREMSDSVEVVLLNADENTSLCKELAIETIPVLLLYQNGDLIWSHTGYISREELLLHIKDK